MACLSRRPSEQRACRVLHHRTQPPRDCSRTTPRTSASGSRTCNRFSASGCSSCTVSQSAVAKHCDPRSRTTFAARPSHTRAGSRTSCSRIPTTTRPCGAPRHRALPVARRGLLTAPRWSTVRPAGEPLTPRSHVSLTNIRKPVRTVVDGHLSQERPDLTSSGSQPGVRLRVASAGSSAARPARRPRPPVAGRQDSAGEPGREQGSQLAPTGDASPARLPARTIGVLSAGSRISPRVASRAPRRVDDGLRLRVTGTVGGGDQRGERRELDTGTRVHHLDHLGRAGRGPGWSASSRAGAPRPAARGSAASRVRKVADRLAPQPEPRAVVSEQPPVTVRGPRQPVVDQRSRRARRCATSTAPSAGVPLAKATSRSGT